MFAHLRESLILWISIILLGSSLAVAQSNPPTPAPSINSTHQEKHPTTGNENPANKPAGTDKNPFVIKSFEAEKTPERTEQDRPEREEKAANERSLIAWTIVLAIATIILAGVAGGQLFMFLKQLRYMRKSIQTSERALHLAERPQLKIEGWNIQIISANKPPKVSFEITNRGRSEAELVDCRMTHSIGTSENYPAKLQSQDVYGIAYPGGGGIAVEYPIKAALTQNQCESLWAKETFIFVYGQLVFVDQFKSTCTIDFVVKAISKKPTGTDVVYVTRKGYNRMTWTDPPQESKD